MSKTAVQTRTAPAPTDERHPDFVVFTAPLAVKHDGADGERPTLVATASSTAIDLEADRFTKSALEQMRDGFKGRVIFMNHQYRVPVDVFGVVEETSLVKREGRLDLDLVIRVETGNPLALQTYEYVVNGTRLGVSVGVIVTEAEKSEDEDEFGKRIVDISGVIPLEASIVGIPANQTAWTQEAVKSLFERGAIDFDEDEIAARPWLITATDVDKEAVAAPFEALEISGRGAVGGHSPTKAPRGRAWQASSAVKRLRTWAGGPAKDDINWRKYSTGFAWFNSESVESFGSYKLPHHDIVNSSFVVVFRGAAAAAVVLQGGRGGVAIPEGDIGRVKSHIARHYHQFDEKAPWEREKGIGWLDIELDVAADLLAEGILADELPAFAEASWPDDEKEDTMSKDTDTDTDADERKEDEVDATEEDTDDSDADDAKKEGDEKPEEKDAADTDEEPDESDADSEKDADSDKDADDEPEEDDSEEPDETKDQEGEDEEGGGEDAHDANDGDGAHKEDDEEPDETKGDFEDDVAADEAADLLIDSMYTGFRVALNNLIGIVLNTDMNAGQRAEAGAEVIAAWKDYIESAWDETIEHLNDEKAVEPNEEFDVEARLHDLVSKDASVTCEAAQVKEIVAQAVEIGDMAQAHAEENKRLQEEVERKAQALEYSAQIIEAVMDLPLPTVTAEATQVARNLAERFPKLDNRVVERLVRYAPKRRN